MTAVSVVCCGIGGAREASSARTTDTSSTKPRWAVPSQASGVGCSAFIVNAWHAFPQVVGATGIEPVTPRL
jgi:hypothetical protein